MSELPLLSAYSQDLQARVRDLLGNGRVSEILLQRYPVAHDVRDDKALYAYVIDLKNDRLRSAAQIHKVAYDNKLHVIRHALGTHTYVSRVQGARLTAKHEIRIASIFRRMPEAFLRMIVAHELAHLREKEHDKAFYKLCQHIEPQYYQYEFDMRLYLTYLEYRRCGDDRDEPVPELWA